MTACAAFGIETCVIENSAVGELPNVATNRPVLFYGSVASSARSSPVDVGIREPTTMTGTSVSRNRCATGARMLNREAVFLTLGEFSAARFAASQKSSFVPTVTSRNFRAACGRCPTSRYVDKLRAAASNGARHAHRGRAHETD